MQKRCALVLVRIIRGLYVLAWPVVQTDTYGVVRDRIRNAGWVW